MTSQRWTALLDEHSLVTLDGGLATELERAGANLDHPLWSGQVLRKQPELITQCHQAYFEAGAQVATTASYQLTREGMQRAGLNPVDFDSLVKLSVSLAREAAPESGVVAGSVGPYGAMLNDGSEYTGGYDLSAAALEAFHLPRISTLVSAGVDVIALETFPSLAEAEAAVAVVAAVSDVPCWVCFSCRDSDTTAAGDALEACARTLRHHPQVSAVGINCVAPEVAIGAARNLSASVDLPVIAYPNSGERYDASHCTWDEQPSELGATEISRELVAAGATVIGGCCRTDPCWISAARKEFTRA